MLFPCLSLMEGPPPSLAQRFRFIVSLASLAYTFTVLHAVQYSMRISDDSTAQNLQNPDSTHSSALSSGTSASHNTLATTSMTGTAEKTTGRWTEDEVNLLLDYVEQNAILTTARGLTLKKSEFNRVRDKIKSKDAGQCHYKWGNVSYQLSTRTLIVILYHYRYVRSIRQFLSGTTSLGPVGTTITVPMHVPRVKSKYFRNG